jgi:hypothetical protein
MATALVGTNAGTSLGASLQQLLIAPDIQPGDQPSYQLAKAIYEYHPLGKKIVDKPLTIAQSQKRDITIGKGPEDRIKRAFLDTWASMSCDEYIFRTASLSRIYGASILAMITDGEGTDKPLDLAKLPGKKTSCNALDPLNVSGSLVLSQNPNDPNFMKPMFTVTGDFGGTVVQGQKYHPSRTVVMMNEAPIYISFTSSTFGYTGRSVYQRALFPLKSFINSMKTDDLVVRKCGVLVAMLKQVGSVVNRVQQFFYGLKRSILKEAEVDNVINIGNEDKVESLDLTNLGQTHEMARKNILQNIASATDQPALMINEETYTDGFGEGTEDAKRVANFVEGMRKWMKPLYDFFDVVVMHKAWTPEFYAALQKEMPEVYGKKDFNTAFVEWKNSFVASWPSLITEPPSEKVQVADVKLRAVIAAVQTFRTDFDPENKVGMIVWAIECFNEMEELFPVSFDLDVSALEEFVAEQKELQDKQSEVALEAGKAEAAGKDEVIKPKSNFSDSALEAAVESERAAVAKLIEDRAKRRRIGRTLKNAA